MTLIGNNPTKVITDDIDEAGYIYVASPYSHPDKWMEEERYRAVLEFTSRKIREGYILYSPIVHCHHMAVTHGLAGDAEFWKRFDRAMVLSSRGVWVFRLSGWEESKGVRGEIILATKYGIPVEYW